MGAAEIERFLTHLAAHGNVAASTRNQALYISVLLYKHVLHMESNEKISSQRAKRQKRLPVVVSRDAVEQAMVYFNGILQPVDKQVSGWQAGKARAISKSAAYGAYVSTFEEAEAPHGGLRSRFGTGCWLMAVFP